MIFLCKNLKNYAIDTHAHLWPIEYLETLKRLGSTQTDIAINEDWNAFENNPLETLKKSFYFDAANLLEAALLNSAEILGFDHLLMGSDFPYFKDKKYITAAEYIRNSRLKDEERLAILSDNAKKLVYY